MNRTNTTRRKAVIAEGKETAEWQALWAPSKDMAFSLSHMQATGQFETEKLDDLL